MKKVNKIRKNITVLSILMLACFNEGFSQLPTNGFKIKGTIGQSENEIIYISYYNGVQAVIDSSKLTNGSFEFSGTVSKPVIANFRLENSDILDSKALPVFIEPTTMYIELKDQPFSIEKVVGSKTHQELEEWITLNNDAKSRLTKVIAAAEIEKDEKKLKLLEDSIAFYNDERKRIEYDFFKSYPQSYATAFVLLFSYRNYTVDELREMYNNMGNELQMSSDGVYLLKHINEMEPSAVGKMAKDFSGKDIMTGKDFSLQEAKGKYVFIDFWGSWCIPCIELIPSLVEEHAKYKNHNIIFLSVAYDTERDLSKAKAIIKEKHMDWVNLWQDRKVEENSITAKFDVRAFPTTVIIDPAGKIIYKREGNDNFIKVSRLLAQIFDVGL